MEPPPGGDLAGGDSPSSGPLAGFLHLHRWKRKQSMQREKEGSKFMHREEGRGATSVGYEMRLGSL